MLNLKACETFKWLYSAGTQITLGSELAEPKAAHVVLRAVRVYAVVKNVEEES